MKRPLLPWMPPRRGDVMGILLGVVLLAGILFLYVWPPFVNRSIGFPSADAGWSCEHLPKTDSVCVRSVPRQPPAGTASP